MTKKVQGDNPVVWIADGGERSYGGPDREKAIRKRRQKKRRAQEREALAWLVELRNLLRGPIGYSGPAGESGAPGPQGPRGVCQCKCSHKEFQ